MRSLIAASKSSSHQFLCLTAGRFFVPTEIPPAPRGTAVNVAVGNRRSRRATSLTAASTVPTLR